MMSPPRLTMICVSYVHELTLVLSYVLGLFRRVPKNPKFEDDLDEVQHLVVVSCSADDDEISVVLVACVGLGEVDPVSLGVLAVLVALALAPWLWLKSLRLLAVELVAAVSICVRFVDTSEVDGRVLG